MNGLTLVWTKLRPVSDSPRDWQFTGDSLRSRQWPEVGIPAGYRGGDEEKETSERKGGKKVNGFWVFPFLKTIFQNCKKNAFSTISKWILKKQN